jgi:hypothetical protein
MKEDGWWWHDAGSTNRSIKRELLREVLKSFARRILALP